MGDGAAVAAAAAAVAAMLFVSVGDVAFLVHGS